MAKIKTIFPPQVPSFLPAFDSKQDNPKFYFKPSVMNTIEQIYGLHVSIVRQDTNETVLGKTTYPFGIIFVNKDGSINSEDGKLNTIRYDKKRKYYYFSLDRNIFPTPNHAYKVQIRAVSIDAVKDEPGQQMPQESKRSEWLNKNLDNFSEWSIVTTVMPITVPDFGIQGFEEREENRINSSGYNFIGYYEPKDPNKSETLSSYSFNIFLYTNFEDKSTWKQYASSGQKNIGIYEKVNIEQTFDRDLEQNKKYVIALTIKTKNLYTKTKYYKIVGAYPIIEMFNSINLEPNKEEGKINVKIQAKQILMKPNPGTEIGYIEDDPGTQQANLKFSHASIDGSISTNQNFSMDASDDKWILQSKVKIDRVYTTLKDAYENPFIEMSDEAGGKAIKILNRVKLCCMKIDLNGYPLMNSRNEVIDQISDWEYRVIARKELVSIQPNGDEMILLSQNKVFRTKDPIVPQQEYYIYLKENQGYMSLDVQKVYKSAKGVKTWLQVYQE